jgi:hypothetical protein
VLYQLRGETVYPEVRVYSDPFEGLTVQLTELRGLIKVVPPLIETDRQRRWDEIGARPSEGEDGDMIDVYEAEAGAEEGWGHADFARTIYVAAVVTAWAVFQDYLARQLNESYLSFDLSQHPPLAALVDEEVRTWDRRFDKIEKRYRDFAGIPLAQWPSWDRVRHVHELRNALVHNQGQYTAAYLRTKLAYRPTKDDLSGFTPPGNDDGLINHETIPLSFTMVDDLIAQLIEVAAEVRDTISRSD